MPVRGLLLSLFFLVPFTNQAGEVPSPLFWETEQDFLEQLNEGQFDAHLELHLLEYAADPRWAAGWSGERYRGNGIWGEYGSTTARLLYVNSQIAVNLFPLERLQIRYERQDYQDGRFDVSDQHLDVIYYPGSRWGLLISGWPTHFKEEASAGLGIKLGGPRSRDSLVLRVVDDRFVWNEKSETGVTFTSQPVRLVASGRAERDKWQVFGSLDFGLEYRAETAQGSTSGSQRFLDLTVAYNSEDWAMGGRITTATLERNQDGDGGSYSLKRSYGRGSLSFRRDFGVWAAYAIAAYSAQNDEFTSPSISEGAYQMRTPILGVEGGRRLGKGLEIRAGYLGSLFSANGAGREEDGYSDKAHIRALYTFRPLLSLELLLSQTVSGSRFGGGAVKARLVW